MAEDDAPRLAAAFPWLRGARLEITEDFPNGSTRHIKHIVVARSPALFIIPCGDAGCCNGGHDITAVLMQAFRKRLAGATGESYCVGTIGSADCKRRIHFTLSAECESPVGGPFDETESQPTR